MDDLDLDAFRSRYDAALAMTTHLPETVPDRARVDEAAAELREDIASIVPVVVAVIDACSDATDRETARWLLTRTQATLGEGPGATDAKAAAHTEDLAHVSRALVAIVRHESLASH